MSAASASVQVRPVGLRALVRRHPLAVYFVLAYTVSWAGILLVAAPGGVPAAPEAVAGLLPLVFLAMVAGPSLAGLLLTALIDGRDGLRALLSRLTRWRVAPFWYAAALLTAPALLLAVLAPLALGSTAFLPKPFTTADPAGLAALALAGGLMAGLFEEIGWSGFATPRLLRRHGWLAAGLLLGLPWWAWHALGDYWGGAAYGGWYLPHLLLWGVALPAYRVLMTRVYARTGSLLVAVLMHAAFTGGQALLEPAWTTAANAVLWYGAFALALWAAVGLVALADRRVGFGASDRAEPSAGSRTQPVGPDRARGDADGRRTVSGRP
jgi:membrane protease YdiL (CAAX protease family)